MPRTATPKHQGILVDNEGVLCLRGEMFWKFKAVDAEHRRAVAELAESTRKLSEAIDKNPEIKALYTARQRLLGEVSTAKNALAETSEALEKQMGVSLRECSIDDETGRVYRILPSGPVPLVPVPPSKKTQRRSR